MIFLFELSHPKHYYQFIPSINILETSGNKVIILARNKDVLLKILNEEGRNYIEYGKHGKTLFSKFFLIPNLLLNFFRVCFKHKPDRIISKASPYAAIIGKFLRIKTIITPDSEVVSLTNKLVAPLSNLIITPKTFGINYGDKHKLITGFFEDCYLHPSVFNPNTHKLDITLSEYLKPFFLLRFISWNANHDMNQFGFSQEEKVELVDFLGKYGSVFISSESELPDSIEHFRLKIPASQMHLFISVSHLYIGDSQSMATEAALLGTPSIRYNSFVGPNDMTNFRVLENKELLINCTNFIEVLTTSKKIIEDKNSKKLWLMKRDEYYKNNGNVNEQLVSFFM